jgi:hypothetical protein
VNEKLKMFLDLQLRNTLEHLVKHAEGKTHDTAMRLYYDFSQSSLDFREFRRLFKETISLLRVCIADLENFHDVEKEVFILMECRASTFEMMQDTILNDEVVS